MSTRRTRLHRGYLTLGAGWIAAGTVALGACGGGHVPLPALSPATIGDTTGLVARGEYVAAPWRCAGTATPPTRATPTAR